MSGAEIRWVRPDSQSYLPPVMSQSRAVEQAERSYALIVIALTFACTALAVFDLFLLATGA